jgi:modified peptide precursor CbpA
MKTPKQIISYRRRCNLIGQGTGLSHYILLTPSADAAPEAGTK